ncbi:MAG: hypothetical protein J6A01_09725 [Proteobacteria bacterium]|nr:hypothetical protein [Pseudomonadota bacterium]
MKFGSSLRNRHVVARMEMGEDFIESLRKYFQRENVGACFFEGFGEFSKCVLQAFNPDKRAMETIFTTDTFSNVPHIIGNITRMGNEIVVNASCILNYRIYNQIYSMSGLIQSAKVYNAELHFTIFDDLRMTRTFDAVTGMVPISRIHSMYEDDNYTSSTGMFHASSSLNVELQDEDTDALSISGLSTLQNTQSNSSAGLSQQPQVIRRKTRASTDELSDLSDLGISESITNIKSTVKRRKSDLNAASSQGISAVPNEPVAESTTEYEFKPGDWAIHPMSGHCRINAILPDNCIRLETPSGSLRDFSMQFFEFERVENYKGRKCFKMNRVQ